MDSITRTSVNAIAAEDAHLVFQCVLADYLLNR